MTTSDNNTIPRWIVFEFTRDMRFPKFSVKAGEEWLARVAPQYRTWDYYRALKGEIERFDFADGQCLAQDVKLVREVY